MYSIQVIIFVMIAVSMVLVQCDPPKPNVDEKCLVPPPNDVDPMNCCKIPELLDSKLIETCATKVYGPDSNPSNQNEPPFAPHIRVSVHQFYLYCANRIKMPIQKRTNKERHNLIELICLQAPIFPIKKKEQTYKNSKQTNVIPISVCYRVHPE